MSISITPNWVPPNLGPEARPKKPNLWSERKRSRGVQQASSSVVSQWSPSSWFWVVQIYSALGFGLRDLVLPAIKINNLWGSLRPVWFAEADIWKTPFVQLHLIKSLLHLATIEVLSGCWIKNNSLWRMVVGSSMSCIKEFESGSFFKLFKIL